ncbi:MAG: M6 family metalloprotease domain-containing protein [Prevotellamassilia sp.]|nr:M6 family metalloprotease domain-containing protein [Prevotellamassilia sp.]
MKKSLSLLFLLLLASTLPAAAQLHRRSMSLRQSDGLRVALNYVGTPLYGCHTTTDGLAVVRGADGFYYYAAETAEGLTATNVQAHNPAERGIAEQKFVTSSAVETSAALQLLSSLNPQPPVRSSRAASTTDGLTPYGQSAGGAIPSVGERRIPVIMAEFSDIKFQDTITVDKMTHMLNDDDFVAVSKGKGSAAQYFRDMSGGLFSPTFDVVARVAVSKDHVYYGADSGSSHHVNITQFIPEAIDSAQAKGVDFSPYVDATLGGVPCVVVIFAGQGQHTSYDADWEDYIWAHFWRRAYTCGGIKFNSYYVGAELANNYYDANGQLVTDANGYGIAQSTHMEGIGVFIHEMSHALGLADLYYTGIDQAISDTLATPGWWSIMDYGQYWADGYQPMGYSAYERARLGWQQVEELTEAKAVKMYNHILTDKEHPSVAYILRSDANPSEYFLLENRQPSHWYPQVMGKGMLITHVYYSSSVWSQNIVNNNPDLQRVAIVPADGSFPFIKYTTASELKGDLFPGPSGNTAFTDESAVRATTYTGTGLLGKPIYDIAQNDDGTVEFSFLQPHLTGIESVNSAAQTEPTAIYRLDGTRVHLSKRSELRRGIYIIRSAEGTRKLIVD